MKTYRSQIVTYLFVAIVVISPITTHAQQTQLIVPQGFVSDSFYEAIGINWGIHQNGPGGGWFFNQGGGVPLPAFGGFSPSPSGFGFGVNGPRGGYHFSIFGAQGSTRSMTSSSAVMTLPNGGIGSIQSGTWTPFVTGWIPVVGDAQPLTFHSPLQDRLRRLRAGETTGPRTHYMQKPPGAQPAPPSSTPDRYATNSAITSRVPNTQSAEFKIDNHVAPAKFIAISQGGAGKLTPNQSNSSANHGDISVAEIRRQNEFADESLQQQVTQLIALAQEAEQQKKYGAARTFYRQAFSRAAGDVKRELADRLANLPRS